MDKNAKYAEHFPKWFMTAISAFGLGFQLLIISFMLSVGWEEHIILFFICYSVLTFVFILIRKGINSEWIGNYVEKANWKITTIYIPLPYFLMLTASLSLICLNALL